MRPQSANSILLLALLLCGSRLYAQSFSFADPTLFQASPSASGFNPNAPLTISNLTIWLKSDAGTFFTSTNQLTNWVSQCGPNSLPPCPAYIFTNLNAIAANSCVTQSVVTLGGHPTLYFSSHTANASFWCTVTNVGSTGVIIANSVFMVCKWDQATSTNNSPVQHNPIWYGTKSSGGSFVSTDNSSAAEIVTSDNNGGGTGANPVMYSARNNIILGTNFIAAAGSWHRYSWRMNGLVGNALKLNFDGRTNQTPAVSAGTFGAQQFVGIPSAHNLNFPFGWIAEVIVYGAQLTDAEWTTVDDYLSAKYGLAARTGP